MDKVTLPLINPDATQGAAMRVIKTARAGAAAVRLGNSFRIVATQAILQSNADNQKIGILAKSFGFDLPNEAAEVIGSSIHFRRDSVVMPRFDAPAGYKQCRDDESHTYPLSYGNSVCPQDGAALDTISIGD
jgi:hypothetical protein